jgi:hypothetical protein
MDDGSFTAVHENADTLHYAVNKDYSPLRQPGLDFRIARYLVVGDNRFSGYPCSGQDQISFEFQISHVKASPTEDAGAMAEKVSRSQNHAHQST